MTREPMMRAVMRAVLTVMGMFLGACGGEKPVPTPPVAVEGDWVNTGRYAACNVYAVQGRECGDAETFDRSACDPPSLARVPADALYTLVYRSEASVPAIGSDAFRVSADGRLDAFHGAAPTERRITPGEFLLSSTRAVSPTVTARDTLVGCRADGDRLYGCYASCRNGRYSSYGTFLAQRWTRRAGEAEASGLRLTSESFVTRGLPVDVYVTQGHAYVVSLPRGPDKGGLSVFDVRDPSAPVLTSTLSPPTDNYWNGVWARGNALYVASADSGVVVLDLANPAVPRVSHQVPSGRGPLNVHTVFVDGERLYAMSPAPQPRTFVFDIREPLSPVLLGDYAEPASPGQPTGYPHDAFAFEGRLYINHWSRGFLLVDVNDPAAPRKLGEYVYPYATSHASAVGRFGDRLIAFEGGESWGAHLRVLDVTDPAHPVQVGQYALDASVSLHNMVLQGSRLYLAHYQHGVRVLDVSVPETPRERAWFNTFRESDPARGLSFYEGAIGMRVPGDGFLYVIDTSRGLLVFPEP